ncbi:hypothetical protein NST62_11685 [Ureibacillus sp. FSL K6-8385]|uniref:Uncharacterized protein n=1 Tax=Ureibacillus terrenus TaxID=118246 RepID=A0A540V3G8_9BACL|nr:hypothetical protein [Ureibacillus terrenus]MED3662848.1 hypothetical protein [Ureibacillus terrenus]MED3763832.1 hypothetical protein [Ureibacillus terrenus]TQE91274.1 hypothetical protein FKZ59_06425 [Ureibacillus terrenus]
MKVNLFFIRLSVIIMIIFGGVFMIRYFAKGELLLDQLIGASAGLILLISSLIWRRYGISGRKRMNHDMKNSLPD